MVHYTDSRDVNWRTINDWHKQRWPNNPDSGGKHIAYHWVIRKDGKIEKGRDESSVGWHVKGFNKESIGIVLTGSNKLSWYPSDGQYDSLVVVLRDVLNRYKILPTQIFFHRDLNSTSCPGRLSKPKLLSMLGEVETEEEEDLFSYAYVCSDKRGLADHPRVGQLNTGTLDGKKGKVWVGISALAEKPRADARILIYPDDSNKGVIKKTIYLKNNREVGYYINDKYHGSLSLRVKSTDGKMRLAVSIVQFYTNT